MSHPQQTLQRAQETIRQLYGELEQTNREVLALTLELEQRVDTLRAEVAERKKAESERQIQVDRLKLLNQIARAISERQDLQSILQVAVNSLEQHLPLDFACTCLHDLNESATTVASIGCHEMALARELALSEGARISIDANSLLRCVRDEAVHEPDTERVAQPFAQQLAKAGLRTLVIAPLRAEKTVLGALVAARRNANSLGADEIEFLRQVAEQVALAAHQAKLHDALQRAYEDLRLTQQAVMQQERLRVLGQLAGGIAHDINNALSPAALYAQLLLERGGSLSNEARNYLTVIQRAIHDVGRTVGRMRMFYRPRELEPALSSIDLNELLQQVMDLTQVRWKNMPDERGIVIRVETELAPGLPPIMGAENEIRDALTNLVFNSLDAMPEGGTLTLRSRMGASARDGNLARGVCVEVCDTGVGMTEAVRARCLEPFFTTKGGRGTGLGLAMVYGMAQRHSAELEIDSQPGGGTTVRLAFPMAPLGEARPPAAHSGATVPLRILLVDDDPVLLRSLCDVLESDGHCVTPADDGQRAIDEFLAARERGESFATVITDLGMPNVNGRTVAAAVKSAAPQTCVILLTGWGQRVQGDDTLPEHVDWVLSKPPRLDELRGALMRLANRATSLPDPRTSC
jgi:signal transduction histidine kinase/ActR/RegA family two-component response regulator